MPLLRLTGPLPDPHSMNFILLLRTFAALDLRTAKDRRDQFASSSTLDLDLPDHAARKLASALLRNHVISGAELITPDNPPEVIPHPEPPPASPIYFCLTCRTRLKHRTECPTCGWLLHPSDRTLWDTRGPCPKCGFSYRYDGARCSHCGATPDPYDPANRPQ